VLLKKHRIVFYVYTSKSVVLLQIILLHKATHKDNRAKGRRGRQCKITPHPHPFTRNALNVSPYEVLPCPLLQRGWLRMSKRTNYLPIPYDTLRLISQGAYFFCFCVTDTVRDGTVLNCRIWQQPAVRSLRSTYICRGWRICDAMLAHSPMGTRPRCTGTNALTNILAVQQLMSQSVSRSGRHIIII
jgi:hypothetical protein